MKMCLLESLLLARRVNSVFVQGDGFWGFCICIFDKVVSLLFLNLK